MGVMSSTELLASVAINGALAAYASWCLWSRTAKYWFKREPPGYLKPILVFWGLSPDASGYERMQRTQAALILGLSMLFIAGSVAARVLTS